MRVLHCVTGLNVGGAEMMLYRFLRELGPVAEDHGVLSLLTPGPIGDLIAGLGVPVFSAGFPRGIVTVRGLADARSAVRRFAPDILHGWMYHGNLAATAGRACCGREAKVIWSIHHSLHDLRRESLVTGMVLRLSALLSHRVAAIAYSARIPADQHERLGYDASKRVILLNGVDLGEFRPQLGARERVLDLCRIPAERIVLGNVARSDPMKDQGALVQALAELLGRGHDVHAVFVGKGSADGAAARLARRLGLVDRVTTLEARDDIADIVPGLDIFVLSSAWGETLSLATLEALASGVAAVVTDVGDSAFLVGDAGEVVPPGDAKALADGIERLVALGQDARRTLGLRGRARVAQHFSLSVHAAGQQALYRRVMDGSE